MGTFRFFFAFLTIIVVLIWLFYVSKVFRAKAMAAVNGQTLFYCTWQIIGYLQIEDCGNCVLCKSVVPFSQQIKELGIFLFTSNIL